MAQGTPLQFSKGALLVGNAPVTPEVFAAMCGITSITQTFNKETGTVNMPDCTNPDLPGWLRIYLISNQMAITGSGTVALESMETFRDWAHSGEFKNVKWVITAPTGEGGGTYAGSALLTQWEMAAEARAPFTFNFGVTFDGEPIWTPLA